MFSIDSVVTAIVYLLVCGAIFWLLNWLIGYVGVPEPFNKAARIILAVAAVLVLIGLLLSFVGHPLVRWGHDGA